MEIHEMLVKLAEINKSKEIDIVKHSSYKVFFKSLSLSELANLGGYSQALYESSTEVAKQKVLRGEHL